MSTITVIIKEGMKELFQHFTKEVATTVVVVMVKAEAMVVLMLMPQPNKDCVLPLVKTHLIADTRQQLMR